MANAGPFTFDTLGALTDKHFLPSLVDQVFLSSPVLAMYRENEREVDGGTQILQPISYQVTPNAGRWGGSTAVLPTSYVEHATAAVHNDVNYFASITIPKTVAAKNRGRRAIVDLIQAQVELAEATLRDAMGVDIYLDGTPDANGNRGLDGLNAVITFGGDGGNGPYGGIERIGAGGEKRAPIGNGFWNGCPLTAGGGLVTRWKGSVDQQSTNTLTLLLMQAAFGAVSQNNEFPTLIVCRQRLYNKYFNLLTVIQRQASSDLEGMQGFRWLLFNDVPIVVDDNCDADDAMYFLNMDHNFWRPYQENNFDATPFMQPVNQLAIVKLISWQGNATCDRPNLQAKVSNIA